MNVRPSRTATASGASSNGRGRSSPRAAAGRGCGYGSSGVGRRSTAAVSPPPFAVTAGRLEPLAQLRRVGRRNCVAAGAIEVYRHGMSAEAPSAAMPDATRGALEARLDALAERLDERRIALEQKRDSRCVFTCAYVLITRRLARGLGTAGYEDPTWIVALAETFAGLYLAALDASAAGEPVGEAWSCVFDAIDRKRSSVLEDLVFSMTAHIVHDLPVALERLGATTATRSRVHDFHAVNQTMGDGISEIESTISRRYAPWVRQLDHLGRPYSRILSNYGIRMSRGLAWYNAVRLADASSRADAQAGTA